MLKSRDLEIEMLKQELKNAETKNQEIQRDKDELIEYLAELTNQVEQQTSSQNA